MRKREGRRRKKRQAGASLPGRGASKASVLEVPQGPVLLQAKIVGHREQLAKLAPLDLDILPKHVVRGDGRLELRAILQPHEVVPTVAAGATVILERLIEPYVPREWIAPARKALAHVHEVLVRVKAAEARQPQRRTPEKRRP